MSLEGALKTKLLQQECHFTWSLREEEDFVLSDLLNRLEEQVQLESDEPRVTRAYSSFGFVQYLNDNPQEALANLQKSVQLAKKLYEDSDKVLIVTYGDLAWLLYHMNDFSMCEDYLKQLEGIRRKLSEGSTYNIEVLREKGWTFLKFSYKYYNAAKECFRRALEMSPDDSDLNTGYAIALYRTTNEPSHPPMIKQLQRAIELDPDDAVLLVLLALRMQRNREDLKTAQMNVIKALVMSPENPHVIRYAAKFYRQLGDSDAAISLLQETLENVPNSAFIHHQLALCYKSKKISLEKQHRADGKTAFAVKESKEIQHYLQKCTEHLEMAISLNPSFVIAVADLALHYGQLDCSEAETFFEKAFEMANNEKQHLQAVHCLYGQHQLYTRRSEQLAIYHFMQGLRLQPKSEQGKLCEEKLKKIIKWRSNSVKKPDDSMVWGIRGFIHEVKGEKLKAEECYERALAKGLDLGESLVFAERRIWLMSFGDLEKYIRKLIFDHGSYDESGSGRLKIFKGAMNKKTVHLVDINICNAKRILRWEKLTPGPHAVLLAFSLNRGEFTDQTKEILEGLEFLGEKFWNHVIVVFKEGDCRINEYTGAQRGVLEWLREKCGHKTYICGSEPELTERIELAERIQRMIRCNNTMHLVLPDISERDSRATTDMRLVVKDCLFTPEVIIQKGQSKYRLQCSHAGSFHCEFTQIGFKMEGEGEVLYSTVLQGSDCPVPANYYQAGPVYDIKCVQGELSQLSLPHCETFIEDANQFMSVIHYSGQIVDILKPQEITSTHVTVSIPGTSRFFISKKMTWFKDHWYKKHGQVMLMYIKQRHQLHVFLQPRNVDPREVERKNKDYRFIQAPCDCKLINYCRYSLSCDPVEKHELPERPVSKIQPLDTKLHLNYQWEHFYPTFDITLPNGVMNVALQLNKKTPMTEEFVDVWKREIPLAESTVENNTPNTFSDEQCVSFLKKNRAEIIERVRNTKGILDRLADRIGNEMMHEIRVKPTPQDQMRSIIDIILSQGVSSTQKLLEVLRKKESHLMKELTTENN